MITPANPKPEYPTLLKLLLAVGVLFIGSLGIILLSIMLNMMGFAYGSLDILSISSAMEAVGVISLGFSIVFGSAISVIGMTMKALTPPNDNHEYHEKQKNEQGLYDIREHGLTVEDVLEDMTMHERELLAERLAESRLAIRDDGTLIPLDQAEKMAKIERFING